MAKKLSIMMPPIRSYSSRKEWEIACWEKMLLSKSLIKFLVTSHERQILVLRAAVIERLSSGKSYRQIEEELRLSPQTISAIKKATHDEKYLSYGERSKKMRKGRPHNPKTEIRKARRLSTPH